MKLTRRDFGKLTVGGIVAVPATAVARGFSPGIAGFSPGAKIDSKVAGVQLGAQSYSFRDMPLDAAIAAMAEIGLGECELWSGHVEPRPQRPPRPAAGGESVRGSQGSPRATGGVQGAPPLSNDRGAGGPASK